MKNVISKILPNSIAEEVGIELGDKLIKINDMEVEDIIDYRFLIVDEVVVIEVEKINGELWSIEIEKEYGEDIGLEFREAIMDKPKNCHNNCIFCFIDQLPKGMRETLYFKDDDSRLSFLQGNFITLTNMSDKDIDRIIRYKISPINVSVHTTNPQLRVKMLNNRFAGNVYERLNKLTEAGISINCQIVLCPGINDGNELIKTIKDLYKLYPRIKNVAVVPVGITKYREGLYDMKLYNKETAKAQLDIIRELQNEYMSKINEPFVRLSDEFYLVAGEEIPEDSFYGEFDQIEDGIGMIRTFRDAIKETISDLNREAKGNFTLVTGELAYNEILKAATIIMDNNENIQVNVAKIINNWFGNTITVSGLLTGTDIIQQLENYPMGEYIIIPNTMLRKGYELGNYKEQMFLDNITVEELQQKLKRKVVVCDYTGENLIKLINNNCKEE